jgi:L-alanine-DL-glutamate epimerase-like enolase superfamily enzyme
MVWFGWERNKFTKGEASIPINGLVWMGTEAFMKQQVKTKIEAGFSCIKMKIGAIDFQTEINLLKAIRAEYSSNDIELRVDANGAFSIDSALDKLKVLSELDLHSIDNRSVFCNKKEKIATNDKSAVHHFKA